MCWEIWYDIIHQPFSLESPVILDSSEKKGPTSHEVQPLSPLMPADSFNQLETYLWDQDKKS